MCSVFSPIKSIFIGMSFILLTFTQISCTPFGLFPLYLTNLLHLARHLRIVAVLILVHAVCISISCLSYAIYHFGESPNSW